MRIFIVLEDGEASSNRVRNQKAKSNKTKSGKQDKTMSNFQSNQVLQVQVNYKNASVSRDSKPKDYSNDSLVWL